MIPVAMRSTGVSAVPFIVPDFVFWFLIIFIINLFFIIDYRYYYWQVASAVPFIVPEPASRRQSWESSSNLDWCWWSSYHSSSFYIQFLCFPTRNRKFLWFNQTITWSDFSQRIPYRRACWGRLPKPRRRIRRRTWQEWTEWTCTLVLDFDKERNPCSEH